MLNISHVFMFFLCGSKRQKAIKRQLSAFLVAHTLINGLQTNSYPTQNLIFPHTLFQEQKQCEKTSDKIILSNNFFFQKSKLNISLGSQSCTCRLFNSSLALLVPFTSFPGCSQKDGCSYSACVLENDSCLNTLQCLPKLLSVCFSSGWGSPKHLPGLIWEGAASSSHRTNWLTLGEDISADMVLNTGQKGAEQMLHEWFR